MSPSAPPAPPPAPAILTMPLAQSPCGTRTHAPPPTSPSPLISAQGIPCIPRLLTPPDRLTLLQKFVARSTIPGPKSQGARSGYRRLICCEQRLFCRKLKKLCCHSHHGSEAFSPTRKRRIRTGFRRSISLTVYWPLIAGLLSISLRPKDSSRSLQGQASGRMNLPLRGTHALLRP